jgi:hypothetical protein
MPTDADIKRVLKRGWRKQRNGDLRRHRTAAHLLGLPMAEIIAVEEKFDDPPQWRAWFITPTPLNCKDSVKGNTLEEAATLLLRRLAERQQEIKDGPRLEPRPPICATCLHCFGSRSEPTCALGEHIVTGAFIPAAAMRLRSVMPVTEESGWWLFTGEICGVKGKFWEKREENENAVSG